MGRLGGGVVHALMGAALWGSRPGLVALAGTDLPEQISYFLNQHVDTTGLYQLAIPQIRAWQIFEHDGTRRELYRVAITEPFIQGAEPAHFPTAYQTSRGFYLLQDFAGIRAWRKALTGIVLWEPLQQIMQPGNHHFLRASLHPGDIDIVSPNLAEAQAVYGLKSPETLLTALLEDGAKSAALRMGPEGALVASQDHNVPEHIPTAPFTVMSDQTGAGNTFCGALLWGIIQGESLVNAARMGSVAASFCLEQVGVLDPARVAVSIRDQRYQQLALT
jgi:sugar/nucleoside kinase (ribokinase family)